MRTIVVGDVHGCLEELNELLRAVGYKSGRDELVLLGDLIDRGPDPRGVIRRVRELRGKSVMGNHEEKAIRWRKHELAKKGKNPVVVAAARAEEWRSFEETDWAFLSGLPRFLRLGSNWAAVHAGVRAGLPLEGQFENELLRMRYMRNTDKRMAQLSEDITPVTHSYWTEEWRGPENIVYGHAVWDDGPRTTGVSVGGETVLTVGLDTGCCFGGSLTAMTLTTLKKSSEPPTLEFASVKARKEYYKYFRPHE